MKIVSWKDVEIVDTPHKMDVRRLYDHENAQVMHITLQPGQSLKPHITPVDVFFYILEGMVDVLVGDETISVKAESLVESPKGIVHSLANSTSSLARIMVVKAPRPTSQTKVL